jgi:hypothetical protein
LGEIRYRLPGAAAFAWLLAQDAEDSAGIGQRAPTGSRHTAHDFGGLCRRGARRRNRRLGQGSHNSEVVGDDVVDLAGDPGTLGRRGERGLLVPLTFQPLRTVVQFGEVSAAGSVVQAESESGGEHSGQEDRVKPPEAARIPEQADDPGDLEHGCAGKCVPPRPHRCHGVQGNQQGRAVDRVIRPQPGAGRGSQDQSEHRQGPDSTDQQRRGCQCQHE